MEESSKKFGLMVSEEIIERVRNALKGNKRKEFMRFDDTSNGILFSDIFKDSLVYNESRETWFYYDGKAWKVDESNMRLEKKAQALSDALWLLSLEENEEGIRKRILQLTSRKKQEQMWKNARTHMSINNSVLDSNPMLLNCQNGVFDLEKGEFMEHKPELYLSKISNIVFDPEAKSNLWNTFTRDIMSEDEEKLQYLQTITGYSLTGDNAREECYLLYGSTTRNGKSTFLNTISYMLGDYACTSQPETFSYRERGSDRPSEDLARLHGIRLVCVNEPAKRMVLDVARLKTLTGGDKVNARKLRENSFDFVPIFKLFFNSNHYPIVNDSTLFASGRIKVITFDRHFTEEERDLHLGAKLRKQENISAIFNWCLDGLKRLQESGGNITIPESVENATEHYRANSDKICSFIEDSLEQSTRENISLSETYDLYKEWCSMNGYYPEGARNFREGLEKYIPVAKSGTVKNKLTGKKQTVYNVLIGYRKKTEAPEGFEPLTRDETF